MEDSTQVQEPVSMDKLVRIYRKMRDKLQELDREYTTKMEEIKVQQDEVKNAIKEQMQALGSKSVSTPSGTAILSKKVRYSTQDWDSFKQFMVDHNALDLLEKRIAQTNMAQFLEENPKLVPPGLNSVAFYVVSESKPTK